MNHRHAILVIDDQAAIRDIIADLLMEFELADRVEVARSVKEAEQALINHHWDAVITDMSLGDGKILDVIESLQQQDYALPPILLISGFLYGQSLQRAKALGIKHILTKPFIPTDLLDSLQQIFASDENIHD
ncbi:MAG: response regulator [Mariprofundus sp.]|nr:response regulator [Mariprofundus sp.]